MLLRALRWRRPAPSALQLPGRRRAAHSSNGQRPHGSAVTSAKAKERDSAADGPQAATNGAASEAAAAPAVDLQLHAPRGELWQGAAAAAALPRQWLAFSDLHVSHKTLATCLQVLERVHEEASRRGAGILFLGETLPPPWPGGAPSMPCMLIRAHRRPRGGGAVPRVCPLLRRAMPHPEPPPAHPHITPARMACLRRRRRLLAHARHAACGAAEPGGAPAGGLAAAHPHAARQPRPGVPARRPAGAQGPGQGWVAGRPQAAAAAAAAQWWAASKLSC